MEFERTVLVRITSMMLIWVNVYGVDRSVVSLKELVWLESPLWFYFWLEYTQSCAGQFVLAVFIASELQGWSYFYSKEEII